MSSTAAAGSRIVEDLEAGTGGNPMGHMVTGGASKEQLVRALLMVSHASIFVGVSAGVRQPATSGSLFARHQAAYYGVAAALLAAVPVEMATAFWLRRCSSPRFHSFAEGLQRVGIVLLITVAAIGGVELTFKA